MAQPGQGGVGRKPGKRGVGGRGRDAVKSIELLFLDYIESWLSRHAAIGLGGLIKIRGVKSM